MPELFQMSEPKKLTINIHQGITLKKTLSLISDQLRKYSNEHPPQRGFSRIFQFAGGALISSRGGFVSVVYITGEVPARAK